MRINHCNQVKVSEYSIRNQQEEEDGKHRIYSPTIKHYKENQIEHEDSRSKWKFKPATRNLKGKFRTSSKGKDRILLTIKPNSLLSPSLL